MMGAHYSGGGGSTSISNPVRAQPPTAAQTSLARPRANGSVAAPPPLTGATMPMQTPSLAGRPPAPLATTALVPATKIATAAGTSTLAAAGGDIWTNLQAAHMTIQQQMQQQFAASVDRAAAQEQQRIEAEYKRSMADLEQRMQVATGAFKQVQAGLMADMQKAKDRRAAQLNDVQSKSGAFLVPHASSTSSLGPQRPSSAPPAVMPSSSAASLLSLALLPTSSSGASSLAVPPMTTKGLATATADVSALYRRSPAFEHWCERALQMHPKTVVATTIELLCRALSANAKAPPADVVGALAPEFRNRHRSSLALLTAPPQQQTHRQPQQQQTTTTTLSTSTTTVTPIQRSARTDLPASAALSFFSARGDISAAVSDHPVPAAPSAAAAWSSGATAAETSPPPAPAPPRADDGWDGVADDGGAPAADIDTANADDLYWPTTEEPLAETDGEATSSVAPQYRPPSLQLRRPSRLKRRLTSR